MNTAMELVIILFALGLSKTLALNYGFFPHYHHILSENLHCQKWCPKFESCGTKYFCCKYKEKQGSCPLVAINGNLFYYFESKSYECFNDFNCPEELKCCHWHNFIHKVCVPSAEAQAPTTTGVATKQTTIVQDTTERFTTETREESTTEGAEETTTQVEEETTTEVITTATEESTNPTTSIAIEPTTSTTEEPTTPTSLPPTTTEEYTEEPGSGEVAAEKRSVLFIDDEDLFHLEKM